MREDRASVFLRAIAGDSRQRHLGCVGYAPRARVLPDICLLAMRPYVFSCGLPLISRILFRHMERLKEPPTVSYEGGDGLMVLMEVDKDLSSLSALMLFFNRFLTLSYANVEMRWARFRV